MNLTRAPHHNNKIAAAEGTVKEEMSSADLAPRERRRAKIKLALVAAAASKIELKPFEAVSVKEICDGICVSENAFYTYFNKKSDLLAYCVELWNLEIQLRAWHAVNGRTGLPMVGAVFEQVSSHVRGRPGLTGELIGILARRREHAAWPHITSIERQIAFPEFTDTGNFEAQPIDEFMEFHLRQAVANGELPSHVRVDAFAGALASFFFGAPVALRSKRAAIDQAYRSQLNMLLVGARAMLPRRNADNDGNVPSLHMRVDS